MLSAGTLTAPGQEPLTVGADPITVGRCAAAHLRLDDPTVSAMHCELRATEHGVLLRDLASTNGTRVGAVAVREVLLVAACAIHVAGHTLHFEPAESKQLVNDGDRESFGALVGSAPNMRRVYELMGLVAKTELSVLITGETGTGKELVARGIHEASPRAGKPLVVVDCTSVPLALAESILFGHEAGSFTGATGRRTGAFLEADGGTLFLDELGELPDEVQPKLLRAVSERRIKRIGSAREEPVNVRIVAATRRDLRNQINRGLFREDLFYRLSQVSIELPPLRDRKEDIPALVANACARLGKHDASESVLRHIEARFASYDWPGNVRELVNAASVLASIDAPSSELLGHLLPHSVGLKERPPPAVTGPSDRDREDEARFSEAKLQFEADYFGRLSQAANGNVSEIARRCGLARHQVRAYLKKLGLRD